MTSKHQATAEVEFFFDTRMKPMVKALRTGPRIAPAAVMSDLGLVRYLGYQTPSLPALRARLEQEQAALLADGAPPVEAAVRSVVEAAAPAWRSARGRR